MRILKYPLSVIGNQKITLPSGAQILSVQVQNGTPCIWALVDEKNIPETIEVMIFVTGEPINSVNGLLYVGTFQLLEQRFVAHVFVKR